MLGQFARALVHEQVRWWIERELYIASEAGADRNALANGWSRDPDNWLCRPVRDGDQPPEAFAGSCHAFIEEGLIFCRNGWQAGVLDFGGMV